MNFSNYFMLSMLMIFFSLMFAGSASGTDFTSGNDCGIMQDTECCVEKKEADGISEPPNTAGSPDASGCKCTCDTDVVIESTALAGQQRFCPMGKAGWRIYLTKKTLIKKKPRSKTSNTKHHEW